MCVTLTRLKVVVQDKKGFIHVYLSKFLTGALPVGVHASVRGGVERTEDGERRSAVNQCWMSKELMEAGGKTLGGMEPCTIQMERNRWGKTPRKFCNTAEKLTRGLDLHPRVP